MYYEEKVIDGVLCYRVNPEGSWLAISYEVVLSRMLKAEQELEAAQQSVKPTSGTRRESMGGRLRKSFTRRSR